MIFVADLSQAQPAPSLHGAFVSAPSNLFILLMADLTVPDLYTVERVTLAAFVDETLGLLARYVKSEFIWEKPGEIQTLFLKPADERSCESHIRIARMSPERASLILTNEQGLTARIRLPFTRRIFSRR